MVIIAPTMHPGSHPESLSFKRWLSIPKNCPQRLFVQVADYNLQAAFFWEASNLHEAAACSIFMLSNKWEKGNDIVVEPESLTVDFKNTNLL